MRPAGPMRASALAAVALTAGALLAAVGPGLSDLPARPGLALQWMRADPERALITAAAVAAWLLLAWLAFGLSVCALTAVPGSAGRLAELLSRRVVPVTVRRAAGLAVGASLATAPVLSAGTALAAPVVPPPVVAAPQPEKPGNPAADPRGGWPDLSRHPSGAAGSAGSPDAPAPAPTPSADPARGPTDAPSYQVRRGDCLWTIAARALGPAADPAAIEAAWHRWYQANRQVIGAYPNLLLPGQRLTAPSG